MSSISVLRRYTPPTCTLEIAAQDSPLSRWFGRPVLKQLKFLLSFDDPRLPEAERLTLRGDQTQLEALREAVEAYVQSFLIQPPAPLDTLLSGSVEPSAPQTPAEPPSLYLFPNPASAIPPEGKPISPDPQAIPPDPLVPASERVAAPNGPPELNLAEQEVLPPTPTPDPTNPAGIYLQPNGLLAHDLFLGSLATPALGSVVRLSLLQLFDLATALDEYAAEMVALPSLNGTPKKGFLPVSLLKTPAWARMAAVVLLTVGVTTAAVKLLENRTSESETAASTANQADITEEQQMAAGASPAPIPLVTPLPPATSLQPLPAPPLLVTPGAPNPNLPPPLGSAVSPTPGVLPPSGSGVTPTPTVSPPVRAMTAPPTSSASGPVRTTAPSQAVSPQAEYKIPTTGRPPSGTQRPSISPTPRTNQATVSQTPPVAVASRQERRAVTTPTPAAAPASPAPSFFPRPGQTPRSAASPTPARPTSPTPTLQTQRSIVNSPSPASPGSPTLKPQTLPSLPAPSTPANNADSSVTALRSAPVTLPEGNRTPAAEGDQGNNAFDTIPQVTEARKYFQQRWQPPSTLTQDIEYSLVLNPNGTIKNIVPRGQAAETFLDRTEMPLVGEPFVSPIEGGNNTTIIVVLSKDGKVQTFLAPSN